MVCIYCKVRIHIFLGKSCLVRFCVICVLFVFGRVIYTSSVKINKTYHEKNPAQSKSFTVLFSLPCCLAHLNILRETMRKLEWQDKQCPSDEANDEKI